jgi:hypothetical protein
MLVLPGLFMATLVRGADNTLGKSLYRTVAELLWVPVRSSLRRRAKAFIDTMVSNAGDGLGALIVLLWVTFGHLPSRFLSVFVILACFVLLYLSRTMGAQYFATLRSRLESSSSAEVLNAPGLERADHLGATFTRLDITRVLATTGIHLDAPPEKPRAAGALADADSADSMTTSELIRTGDAALISNALDGPADWTVEDVPSLTTFLARDAWLARAVHALASVGLEAVPYLISVLGDESADFVIRRRIPRVLAQIDHPDADRALMDALQAGRFEVRYRVALALRRRRQKSLPTARGDRETETWEAIRAELNREKPVWELARLLDSEADDGFVESRIGLRGELSLEHTFRLLSLVLEHKTTRAAYHGIVLDDPELNSFALEYLEQVLPADIRDRLWPFIGDLSASAARRSIRALDDVVADLLQTGATLFGSPEDREALRRYLEEDDDRDLDAVLTRHLDRPLVAGVRMPDHAHARVRRQHSLEPALRSQGAVHDDYLTRVLRVSDPDPTAVVEAHPGGPTDRVEQGVEDWPVGNGIRAVLHPLRLSVRTRHRSRIEVVAPDHDWRLHLAPGHHQVEPVPGSGPLAIAQPADPCRKTLKLHALARQLEPTVQMSVLGKQLHHRLVRAVDVLRIA